MVQARLKYKNIKMQNVVGKNFMEITERVCMRMSEYVKLQHHFMFRQLNNVTYARYRQKRIQTQRLAYD